MRTIAIRAATAAHVTFATLFIGGPAYINLPPYADR